jgi:hypothetical protein
MTRVVRVSRDQIESARLLIKISGGEDKVDPVFVKIANAQPAQGNGANGNNGP